MNHQLSFKDLEIVTRKLPKFLLDFGITSIRVKPLSGGMGYITNEYVGGVKTNRKQIIIDRNLSDAGKLITLFHEWMHEYFNTGGILDARGENNVRDQEWLLLDALGISLPDKERVKGHVRW